ncbi:MAG: metallophosphoesterase [Thermodesulfobacteriota bacterium]|nr:MAG: metallophosphoesterase [Thermodesulfobacteriota bacterium]
MFRTILISIVSLVHMYVFWRIASVPFVYRFVSIKVLVGVGVVLWAGFFFALFFGHGRTESLPATLELLGMNWLGILFLAFVSFLAIEIITGFGLLFPRMAFSLRGLALVASGVLSGIALLQGARPPVVQSYEVNLSGLPNKMDGTVVVVMSDLHLGSLLGKQWLEARIKQVLALHPDLVVLLGDIFEGHGEPQRDLLPVLRGLSAPLGLWAVLGNHEFYGGWGKEMFLDNEDGIQLLRNRWVEVAPGLILAGVDDLTVAGHRVGQESNSLLKTLGGRPPGVTILLSHTPWQVKTAARSGVNLMLCGHTHDGQIWPFGYLVHRFYPLLEGRYEVDGMTAIVCRGTGTWGPRMRLWLPGEILRVTLRKKEN